MKCLLQSSLHLPKSRVGLTSTDVRKNLFLVLLLKGQREALPRKRTVSAKVQNDEWDCGTPLAANAKGCGLKSNGTLRIYNFFKIVRR